MDPSIANTMKALYENDWDLQPSTDLLEKRIEALKPGHASGSALAMASLPSQVANELFTELGAHITTLTSSSAQMLARSLAFFGVIQLSLAYHYVTTDKAREELFVKLTGSHNPDRPLSFTSPDLNLAMLALSTSADYDYQTPSLSAKIDTFLRDMNVSREARDIHTQMCEFFITKFQGEETSRRIASLIRPDIVDVTKKVLISFLRTGNQENNSKVYQRVRRVLFYAGHSNIKLNKVFTPWGDEQDRSTLAHLCFLSQFQREATLANRRTYRNVLRKRKRKANDSLVEVQAQPVPQASKEMETNDSLVEVQAQPVPQASTETEKAQPVLRRSTRQSTKHKRAKKSK